MFPRNLTLFRFAQTLSFAALDEGLAEFRLKPVGPLEMASRGFVPVMGSAAPGLSHEVSGMIWCAVGGENKILPATVVNDAAAKKATEIEQREGRRLGGRARRRVKEEVLHDLLPRALVRPGRCDVFIDTVTGVVAIATASRRTAEGAISELRQALGSFPALPLNAEVSPRTVLTEWVAGGDLPEGLALGDECELRDPADRGAVIRASRQELEAEEIAKHLEAGKQCARLALNLDDHLAFVFGDDLVVRKLAFLDGAVESLENTERDSVQAELDARFALFVGEFRRMFAVLAAAFQLSEVE